MSGGELLEGTTTNLELDDLLTTYMPHPLFTKCTRLVHVSPQLYKQAVKRVKSDTRHFYFPIHTRHHWLAAILVYDDNPKTVRLRVFDSAPSIIVRKDVRKAFTKLDPDLKISFVKCVPQEKHSNDCGLFMLAYIFADALEERICSPRSLPAKLRPFFHDALQRRVPKPAFLQQLRELLGSRSKTVGTEQKTPLTGGAAGAEEDDFLLRELMPRDDPPAAEEDAAEAGGHDEASRTIMREADEHMEALTRRNLTGFMTAVALHRRRLGARIALTVDALSMRKLRLRITEDDPGATLEKLPILVFPYRGEVAEEDAATAPQDEGYVLKRTTAEVLPRNLRNVKFVLGITHRLVPIPMMRQRGGRQEDAEEDALPPRQPAMKHAYALTTQPAEAMYGLYMPLAGNPHEEREVPDRERLLNGDELGLNGRGSRPRGYVCPRHWQVSRGKPTRVSQAAWEKVSASTRQQHRRAIEDLTCMPHDLLSLDLAAAAIRLIQRAAYLKKWKASTIVSKFATMHGALMNLPLYTDQAHSINLKESPEWNAAYGKWHQVMNSEIPHPPPHVYKTQVDAAARELRDDPEARLFLMMMCSFAARAGDIGGLKPTDVTLQTPTADTYPVGLTYRRGKATHFRGPYPVASHLSREDGSRLASLLSQRPENSPLFKDPAATKKKVRAALKTAFPALELASIRKGAVHHLARAGVAEADIMRLTGHTSVITLRRYLNYSQQPTREAVMAQDSASALLRDQTQ